MSSLTSKQISKKLDINEIVATILKKRGIDTDNKIDSFLNSGLKELYDSSMMPGAKEVSKKIKEYAIFGGTIIIYCDYDCDGITSAYIMKKAIKKMASSSDVTIFISDRFRDGYGLSKNSVDIISKEKADLVITLDCGIANHDEIEYAKDKSIETVIIDHHEEIEPPEVPFVDLKVKQGDYPFRGLCSAGVTWKFCRYMLDEEYTEALDIAAIGTVADVVPLVDENRIIVKEGIKKIKKGKANKGIKSLMEVNDIEKKDFKSNDIGYGIGPMVNAAGRLGSAYPALEILLEEDKQKRTSLAGKLESINKQRRDITKSVFNEVKNKANKDNNVIVCETEAHQGIVGLIAGRVKREFNKPAIVVDELSRKGSCRSVKPFNIYKNLKACLDKGLLNEAGGHEMAAGIRVSKKDLDSFKKEINKMAEGIDYKVSSHDIEIETDQIDDGLLKDLELLEPCGKGNEKPRFLTKNIKADNVWVLPGNDHVKFSVNGIEAIAFYMAEYEDLLRNNKVDIVYNLNYNKWNGSKNIQLNIREINRGNKNETR